MEISSFTGKLLQKTNWYLRRIAEMSGKLRFRIDLLLEEQEIKKYGKPYYNGLSYKQIVPKDRRLVILANGPSLPEDIALLKKQGSLENTDFLMMNFSVSQNYYSEFKPKFYALADPMFFGEDYRIEKVKHMFCELNEKTTWDITLLLAYDVNEFIKFSGITNPRIHFQRIRHIVYPGNDEKKYIFYENGSSMPILGTVANMGLYAGIQYGYKQIELCGVDMSFFDGICINDNNEVCTIEKHYYDKEKYTLKPYRGVSNDKSMPLDQYINMVNYMVVSYRQLADYAKCKNVFVLNRTRKSMIDCYPRLIQTNPELFD